MDHIAGWVRFADSKATILAAGLAATLALLGGRLDTIVEALNGTCPQHTITIGLGVITLAAALWTLYWLISAVNPRSDVNGHGLNRFAWPAMAKASHDEVEAHVKAVCTERDAWKQASDLARIADKKFSRTKRATFGFALTLTAGVALVVYSALVT